MKDLGLLQPLGIPNLKFESISMNFIVRLPKIQNNFDSIIVVVNRLKKNTHFIPTVSTVIAYGVAELFMREIFKHHRIPREIISDRDHKFVSEFWTTLFKLCGTKFKLSSAYLLETDGQTERTNITLENMLKMYGGKRQLSWDKWLHMIEYAYNDHIHNSIGVNPFYVLYGQECKTPITLSTPSTRFESINAMIKLMNKIRESTKLAMKSAHDKAKH